MRAVLLLGLTLAGAATVGASTPLLAQVGGAPVTAAEASPHVRLTARIVVLDRQALTQAGLSYLLIGNDRVRLSSTSRSRPPAAFRAHLSRGATGVTAFLEAARASRWIRSEHTQQILTLSGSEASISSSDLTVGPYAARSRGPSLVVTPTVLPDGRVHLNVSAAVEDRMVDSWGYSVEGAPVSAHAEIVAHDREELVLASGSSVEASSEVALLRFSRSERERDVLVLITPQVLPR